MNKNAESENTRPLVTVITVTWNIIRAGRKAFLSECIESVHKQDYPNIEHIIIDGASDDGTLEFLSKYETDGWITCYSEPDKGIYDAMNKGIRRANGKYIAFLNSDDHWHDVTGVSQSVKMLELIQADFSYAPRKIINCDGSLNSYEITSLALLFNRMPFCHQTMFTRTDFIRKLHGFADDRLRISADYDLVTRLLMAGARPVYVPCCFTSFRLGGASVDAETVEKELHEIHKYNYGAFVNDNDIADIRSGILPSYILTILRGFFHHSVMAEIERYATRVDDRICFPCEFLYCDEATKVLNIGAQPSAVMGNSSKSIKLLGIPVAKICFRGNEKSLSLLGIPFFILKKKKSGTWLKTIVRVLGVALCYKLQDVSMYKIVLFGCIPLFTCKKRLS